MLLYTILTGIFSTALFLFLQQPSDVTTFDGSGDVESIMDIGKTKEKQVLKTNGIF